MISRPSAQRSRRGALYSGLDGSGGPRRRLVTDFLEGTGFEGHADSVSALGFSADGTLLASAGLDGTVRVWSATDGSSYRLPGEEQYRCR